MLSDFEELILISQCHAKGKRYPAIKNWFLNTYPAIKEFGMPKEQNNKNENVANEQKEEVMLKMVS